MSVSSNFYSVGKLDEATMAMMNMARCGVADVTGHSLDAKRRRRYSLARRWPKTDLSFRIDSVTSNIANRTDVENTLIRALHVSFCIFPPSSSL